MRPPEEPLTSLRATLEATLLHPYRPCSCHLPLALQICQYSLLCSVDTPIPLIRTPVWAEWTEERSACTGPLRSTECTRPCVHAQEHVMPKGSTRHAKGLHTWSTRHTQPLHSRNLVLCCAAACHDRYHVKKTIKTKKKGRTAKGETINNGMTQLDAERPPPHSARKPPHKPSTRSHTLRHVECPHANAH